jgi:hypothetical protein
MKSRRKLIVGAICIIALGTVLALDHAPEVLPAKPAAPPPAQGPAKTDAVAAAPAAPEPPTAELAAEPPRMVAEASQDIFAGKSWYVPPPPPPEPKPVAPPFPYTYAGSIRDPDDVILFVSQGDRSFIVRKGETLGGSYRFDDVVDNRAFFTYLPLQERQSLTMGINP